jgi:hypothetical protein
MGKDERKRIKYVLITDSDMEDVGDLLPKKADCKVLQVLIPNQDLAIKAITGKIDKKDFQEEYYRYLTRPICRAALTKIAKYAFFDNRDVAVCFGLMEQDLNVHKYLIRAFESMFPDIKVFKYSDWKDDPYRVINYNPDNIGTISIQISEYANQVGRKLLELETCKDGYTKHSFYNDEED